jgi:hypothetical protein
MQRPIDYERLGRQVALPELGVDGQRALAARPVRFVGDDATRADAERIWSHAGGLVADATEDALEITLAAPSNEPAYSLGVAAWAALEAARALLGWPAAPRPTALDHALSSTSTKLSP